MSAAATFSQLNLSIATEQDAADASALHIANDVDLSAASAELLAQIKAATTIVLDFPKFTDGRAYSQARILRSRLGYKAALRATGDVLVDQVTHMARVGFTDAVLRSDQNLAVAKAQLARFDAFYQGDAVIVQPHFSRTAHAEAAVS